MKQLSVLAPNDAVHLDQKQLANLYVKMGPTQAEEVVCRAMEELARRLSNLEALNAKGQFENVSKAARRLVGIAEQIGLVDLANVARHVESCFLRPDRVAQFAVLNRLYRVADASLTEVWQGHDLTL